jgi:hypothetical protein
MIEFSGRFIGVELEIPKNNPLLESHMKALDWKTPFEAAIPREGKEYVSPKLKGREIFDQISLFYDLLKECNLDIEHYTCSTHVHIDATDIYPLAWQNPGREANILQFGNQISKLCRLFVSLERNKTAYALGGCGIRMNRPGPPVCRSAPCLHHPVVCLRNETFEFRLFPPTNDPEYLLARVAFAQATIDCLFRNLDSPPEIPASFEDSGLLKILDILNLSDNIKRLLVTMFRQYKSDNIQLVPKIWDLEEKGQIPMTIMNPDRWEYIDWSCITQ